MSAKLAGVVVVLGAVVATLMLGGLGIGKAPTAVQLTVTRDFGSHALRSNGPLKASENETVMSLLRAHDTISTVSGGHIVEGIDGLASGVRAGHRQNWFYYVNGVEALRGASTTGVSPGDHVWWDLHDWSQAEKIPAVVGSFPEPFVNGIEGRRWPVRVECAAASGTACRTVIARLRALNVPAAVAAIGSGGAPETLRVMVAPFGGLEAVLAESLERGPRENGIYARFSANGRALALLNQDGGVAQTLSSGAGLIAATRQREEAPTWVITGTDGAGVELAARSFDQATLEHRFAVAVAPGAAIALPELSP
ncbi:MAG TPA: DUF4430 domain-containing protein [Solirubrobacteraceae bacterium]|nr:DUF4430 domain-containing protein [Solirubrobacteraceae bacterium]